MPDALVRSVNVGMPQDRAWAAIGRTSIDKQPATGRVACGRLGLVGDQASDTKHHGGVDQAVYAFAREDLDAWEVDLGQPIRDGQFGENLTTEGLDLNQAELGERWRVGSALLEVASVRIPCNDFKNWMGECGYSPRAWVKRFTQAGRPGPYLRVLQDGDVGAGDTLDVVHRPGHGVTVGTMFAALTTEPALLPRLLVVDDLVEEARRKAERYAGAGRPPSR